MLPLDMPKGFFSGGVRFVCSGSLWPAARLPQNYLESRISLARSMRDLVWAYGGSLAGREFWLVEVLSSEVDGLPSGKTAYAKKLGTFRFRRIRYSPGSRGCAR